MKIKDYSFTYLFTVYLIMPSVAQDYKGLNEGFISE
jgi:hypothetical protein